MARVRVELLRVTAGEPGAGPLRLIVREVDVADRQVTALRTQTASYTGPDGKTTAEANCDVLAVDPTGQHALVRGFGFGRIDNGTFTPLPGIPPDAVLASAAW